MNTQHLVDGCLQPLCATISGRCEQFSEISNKYCLGKDAIMPSDAALARTVSHTLLWAATCIMSQLVFTMPMTILHSYFAVILQKHI